MRRWLHYSLASVLVWGAFFALISILPVLSGMATYGEVFRLTVTHWFPWVLLSPVIVWFTCRYPVEWNGWRWRVLAHLLAVVLFVSICTWLGQFVDTRLQTFEPPGGRMGFTHGPPSLAHPDGWDHLGPPPDPDQDQPPDSRIPRFEPGQGPPVWMRAGFNLPVYLTIVSLCHAFVYFRRTQQRERRALELETQLGQARLEALRMQLQPHFLFNTLNAISTLVQTNPAAAQEMIGSLGQMLRLSLDSAPDPEVPLHQELKFLNCYLGIAQMRFGDRLEVKFDVDPATTDALVPTFILQPLVENAVRHGIEPGTGRGSIKISVRQGNQILHISIRDTGAGLVEDPPPSAGQNGIGIANTKARLESLYPGRHYFIVRNSATGGCVAELEIPFHTRPLAPIGEKTASLVAEIDP